jgi:chemotaxis protein CheD
MGEANVVSGHGGELVILGLGSCIGVALLDRRARVAGLAHVVLPEMLATSISPAGVADWVVRALLSALRSAGADPGRMEAVLVGGAYAYTSPMFVDIGRRNEAAVRELLALDRIPVRAADTGGTRARVIRVRSDPGTVESRVSGSQEWTLLSGPGPASWTARATRDAT